MISNLYERRLLDQIEEVPRHVALVVAEKDLNNVEAYKKLGAFTTWCRDLGVSRVTIYINMLRLGEEVNQKLRSQIVQRISEHLQSSSVAASIYSQDAQDLASSDQAPAVSISIGYGGKNELVDAIRSIAQKVKDKELRADDISEATVSSHLIFKEEPELVIRTGENRLTDFLIWQAVYAELYFTEVNWANFRRMDLLRAIRDYQKRQQRHGL
ncbi:MAG: undecaprenyl diphosphate synthase family protein [Euryarchaeota archaeon]|nr:undecaprenyl diphosphate synthase family protein [Euryarchaeota archaeon]